MQGPNNNNGDPDNSQSGIYLYCFTRPGMVASAADLGVAGVDGTHSLAFNTVHEIAALHSPVALEEFSGPDAEISLKDPNWIVPRACRHEQVIEAMMARSPVFPMRFGALFSSKQVLDQMMGECQEEISQFLDSITGKEEWSLKGYLNPSQAGEWLTLADADLASRHRLLPEATGARYLQLKRFQTELQKQVKRWCNTALDSVHEELQGLGSEVIQLPLRAAETSEREMVYHATILLDRQRLQDFQSLSERLNLELAGKGMVLESSGPWPPYHFCPSLTEPE